MGKQILKALVAAIALLAGPAGAAPDKTDKTVKLPSAAELRAMNARFAPVDLQADLSALPESERQALARILQAAQVMDALFLRQVWAGNETVLLPLLKDGASPGLGKERLHAFLLNKGPWTRLDHDAPFLPGVPDKPAGANFYPPGSTKAEIEAWMKSLPEAERKLAGGFFTTVRRGDGKKLRAIPYSLEYQGELGRAAALLSEAAALTQQKSLREYLGKLAGAFLKNDYYDADIAWMLLDASIEPTIGPHEVYEDEWFNAKAGFEAFVTLRDDAETEKLQKFGAQLQDIEDHLPIDNELKNPKIGALAPIRVVNSIYCAGDGNRGVQTAAFNLPNDERVTKEKGTKRVMLKNVQEAKFNRVLLPIARVALGKADQKQVTFEAFFTPILMHELMHGLGPHNIVVGGKPTTVRAELQDAYSAIEEAKADISGLFALQHLIDKGVVDRGLERPMYVTFLASAFRSIRFGIGEAHGKGIAVQINYLLDAGAYRVDKDGTFSVDPGKIKDAVTSLTREFMTLQGHGDQKRARELLGRLAVIRPEVQRVLDRLSSVPVDIEPRFPTAEKLLAAGK